MVIENLGMGFFILPATGKNHYVVWDYKDFYDRWNGYMKFPSECVWIVPGTIDE